MMMMMMMTTMTILTLQDAFGAHAGEDKEAEADSACVKYQCIRHDFV